MYIWYGDGDGVVQCAVSISSGCTCM